MLNCQKNHFDIPKDITFLNCAYMSPLPNLAVEAGQEGIRRKQQPWTMSSADFFPEVEEAKALFAALIGGNASDISIAPSTSYGIATAAKNIPVKSGENIIVLEEQFPSNIYSWRRKAKENAAQIRTVERPDDYDWARAIIEKMDEKTAVVSVPNVHWIDGSVIDLTALSYACQAVEAALVIDGTQSIGVFPIDVKDCEPDFIACGTYKWLLGPYSYGFLYTAPKWQTGVPLEENWIARAGSEDFSGLVHYRDEYGAGAQRFDVGERSNFGLTPIAIASLKLLNQWTVPKISDYLHMLTSRAAAGADVLGLTVVPEHRRSPHMLGIRFDGIDPKVLAQKMLDANVLVSVRSNAVRLAPHVFNDTTDIDLFLSVLENSLKK